MPRAHICGSVLVWGVLALSPQTPTPNIRTSVKLVTAPTLVFSKDGRLVPGLEAGDFRVLDNGQSQKVALDTSSVPVSVVFVIQTNHEVREYVPFIAKAGAVVESLLLGESGEAAILACGNEVKLVKPFETATFNRRFAKSRPTAVSPILLDAGLRGLTLLKQRPAGRARFLIFIGQPMDSGSQINLPFLKAAIEGENVTVFAITLPEFGKAFVSDNFSLSPLHKADRGGYQASVNLGALLAALSRSSHAEAATDPFSVLIAATGGTEMHVRKQREFEEAISAIGEELRSAYQLSYVPATREPGYHTIKVAVNVPDATVFSRPGYWRAVE
jgi:VWFA-related protein